MERRNWFRFFFRLHFNSCSFPPLAFCWAAVTVPWSTVASRSTATTERDRLLPLLRQLSLASSRLLSQLHFPKYCAIEWHEWPDKLTVSVQGSPAWPSRSIDGDCSPAAPPCLLSVKKSTLHDMPERPMEMPPELSGLAKPRICSDLYFIAMCAFEISNLLCICTQVLYAGDPERPLTTIKMFG